MSFSRILCCAALVLSPLTVSSVAAQSAPAKTDVTAAAGKPGKEKVLRYAFQIAESGFDGAQVSDVYSRILTANIFDALYMYDFLARPAKVRPNVAVAMPEITDNFKTYTVKIRPGIYFADDPAFGGKKRELTAQDFVYSYKRHYDPKLKSPSVYLLENDKVLGLSELKKDAQERMKTDKNAKFDYDREVEGIRALDRYTIQFKLGETRPRFIYYLADPGVFGAVAREVVEKYGDKIMEHPVGTGPFVLSQWKRSSKITLSRSPSYRNEPYEAEPPADDARSQAIYAKLKGKPTPFVDKVEVSIIEEAQPRWLAFQGGEHDVLERLPNAFSTIAIPGNKLAPNLAKQGIEMDRVPALDVTFTYFGMEHPVIGGYTPEKVALRRAISLAYDSYEEVRSARRNQAVVSQSSIAPATYGYDPKFKSEMSTFDRARAMALLDMYGYTDKNGDGWRDLPDGKPLVLEYASSPDAVSRELLELWKKNMDKVGIKLEAKIAKWPEHLRASRAGKLMMWGLAWSAGSPDGETFLALAHGSSKGQSNHSRFVNAEFDRLFEAQKLIPDGPERLALMQDAAKIMVAYMPYKTNSHRLHTDLNQPWVVGYRRHPTMREFWRFVDIDTDKLPK